MLKGAIVIREVESEAGSGARYEVYDSDTGTSLGIYDSLDKAQAERRRMDASDWVAKQGGAGQDADMGSE